MTREVIDEAAMHQLAAELVGNWGPGWIIRLQGDLGAGKTTFVRGAISALGFSGSVKSPTFSLIQTYETDPPVLHADLYRVTSGEGLGLEDYLSDHLSFIEWPSNAGAWLDQFRPSVDVVIDFAELGRRVTVHPPVF